MRPVGGIAKVIKGMQPVHRARRIFQVAINGAARSPGSLGVSSQRAHLQQVAEAYSTGTSAQRATAVATLAEDRLPYEEYIRQLALLGLHKSDNSLEDHSEALGRKIGCSIHVRRVSTWEYERNKLPGTAHMDSLGRLVLIPGSTDVYIEVPSSLSPWLYHYVVRHEFGHLSCSHPLRVSDADSSGTAWTHPPTDRLCRNAPIVSELPEQALIDLYEAEADLCAEYGMMTASFGADAVETTRLSQIH